MYFVIFQCFRNTLSEVWVTEYAVYTKFRHVFFLLFSRSFFSVVAYWQFYTLCTKFGHILFVHFEFLCILLLLIVVFCWKFSGGQRRTLWRPTTGTSSGWWTPPSLCPRGCLAFPRMSWRILKRSWVLSGCSIIVFIFYFVLINSTCPVL